MKLLVLLSVLLCLFACQLSGESLFSLYKLYFRFNNLLKATVGMS